MDIKRKRKTSLPLFFFGLFNVRGDNSRADLRVVFDMPQIFAHDLDFHPFLSVFRAFRKGKKTNKEWIVDIEWESSALPRRRQTPVQARLDSLKKERRKWPCLWSVVAERAAGLVLQPMPSRPFYPLICFPPFPLAVVCLCQWRPIAFSLASLSLFIRLSMIQVAKWWCQHNPPPTSYQKKTVKIGLLHFIFYWPTRS